MYIVNVCTKEGKYDLPDGHHAFTTFDGAKRYVVKEILHKAEEATTEGLAEELTLFAGDVSSVSCPFPSRSRWAIHCGSLTYWVQEAS